MERDIFLVILDLLIVHFNSHAHVERDCEMIAASLRNIHFNSHAHVERDFIVIIFPVCLLISTHTLTWSMTIYNSKKLPMLLHFNSHAHVERDAKRKSGDDE